MLDEKDGVCYIMNIQNFNEASVRTFMCESLEYLQHFVVAVGCEITIIYWRYIFFPMYYD